MKKVILVLISLGAFAAFGNDGDLSCTQLSTKKDLRVSSESTVLYENEDYKVNIQSLHSEGTFLQSGTQLPFESTLRDFRFATVSKYSIPPALLGNMEKIEQPFTLQEFYDARCFVYKKNGRSYKHWVLAGAKEVGECKYPRDSLESRLIKRNITEIAQTKLVRFQNEDVSLTIECRNPDRCNIEKMGTLLGFKNPLSPYPLHLTSRQSCSKEDIVIEESVDSNIAN